MHLKRSVNSSDNCVPVCVFLVWTFPRSLKHPGFPVNPILGIPGILPGHHQAIPDLVCHQLTGLPLVIIQVCPGNVPAIPRQTVLGASVVISKNLLLKPFWLGWHWTQVLWSSVVLVVLVFVLSILLLVKVPIVLVWHVGCLCFIVPGGC